MKKLLNELSLKHAGYEKKRPALLSPANKLLVESTLQSLGST